MSLQLLLDLLTGNLALVDVPVTSEPGALAGQPIGLLLALTYS